MKGNRKKAWSVVLAAVMALSLAACTSASPEDGGGGTGIDPAAGTVSNGDWKLSVPSEYSDLLVIETPEDSEDGILFAVSEKASVEAGRAQGMTDDDGAGWLFSIGQISEEKLHEMLSYDMSGQQVFAGDADGSYYVFYHPTDVRLVRESNEEMQAASEQWSALNEWARTVPETFQKDNEGLSPAEFGNTDLEMYLNRIAYMDDTYYTVSTTEYGPLYSEDFDPVPYIELLTKDVSYSPAEGMEAPDGEYVVLCFPDDDVRFDFFLAEGGENYIRQVWSGENETLYEAVFDDGETSASGVMRDWYHGLASAVGAGSAAAGEGSDDLVGTWAEKIAGRGNITIRSGAEEGQYDVQINWSGSAFEMNVWTMTASVAGDGGSISYDNGRLTTVTFSEEGTESEEVKYENGTGSFSLNSEGQLVWKDDVGHAGDDAVFVRAD